MGRSISALRPLWQIQGPTAANPPQRGVSSELPSATEVPLGFVLFAALFVDLLSTLLLRSHFRWRSCDVLCGAHPITCLAKLCRGVIMFLGSIPRRPDKAEAHKTLRKHLTYLGVWICAIRATPYLLALLSKQDETLELDFD